VKRFNVVLPRDDGGVEIHPMKEWLRRHPEHIPPGLDPTSSTSHQLRNGLKKIGWSVQDLTNEVRLLMPGASNVENAIDAVLGEETEQDDCDWFISEYDGEDLFFGYAIIGNPEFAEWGYISFTELKQIRIPPGIEVDCEIFDPPLKASEIEEITIR
jgi:hypothetical protein